VVRFALPLSALAAALVAYVAVAAGSGGGSTPSDSGAHLHPHGSGYDPPPPSTPPPPPASAPVGARSLVATVGPAFTISLTRADGAAVTNLDPGAYVINVDDRGVEHNFHLSGPGLRKQLTGIDFVGTKTVTVTLRSGTYRFVCVPHADDMKGAFKVR
jgi:hypothetical protein